MSVSMQDASVCTCSLYCVVALRSHFILALFHINIWSTTLKKNENMHMIPSISGPMEIESKVSYCNNTSPVSRKHLIGKVPKMVTSGFLDYTAIIRTNCNHNICHLHIKIMQ